MFRRYLMVVALSLTASAPAISASDTTPDATGLLQKGDFQHLEQYFSGVQSRFRGGQASAEELRNAFRAFYPTDRSLAPKYDAWVSRYPKSNRTSADVRRCSQKVHGSARGQMGWEP